MTDTKEEAESMYEKLKPYLVKRGLELAPEKTKVVHISEGFDFLGFTIRQFPTAKEKEDYGSCLLDQVRNRSRKQLQKLKPVLKNTKVVTYRH